MKILDKAFSQKKLIKVEEKAKPEAEPVAELKENEKTLIDEYFNLFDANHDGKIVYSEMEKTLKDHSDGENVEEKFMAFLNKYDKSYENNYVSKRMVTDYFAAAKSDEVQIETILTNMIQKINKVSLAGGAGCGGGRGSGGRGTN